MLHHCRVCDLLECLPATLISILLLLAWLHDTVFPPLLFALRLADWVCVDLSFRLLSYFLLQLALILLNFLFQQVLVVLDRLELVFHMVEILFVLVACKGLWSGRL